ncbi:MAG: hypothetical protein M3Y39_00570 [Chloroflexota bacterium]|nr:hypothetical protein [Chloroflexota bacterium]
MEERQIQEFVHRISSDDVLRQELMSDPEQVIAREDFSPTVTSILMKLVPSLSLTTLEGPQLSWWRG